CIFTTAKRCYAEKILDVLDPKRQLIKHCLFQEDCLCAHGTYWKDLTSLGRDLAKTVALDHTMQGFSNQVANWLPGMPWLGDMWDQELLFLLPLLEYFSQAVRTKGGWRGA
ncbi:CTSL2 protein, partial [Alcedo cyanopectus]|nr:CTSL2 protein [Ceyx cyanopectus]